MFIHNKSGNLAIGRVSRDPEQRTFNSGKTKASFSIMYGEDASEKDANGRAKGLFLTIDAWEAIGNDAMLLQKGDVVAVTGRIDQHEYNEKTYTSLIADAIFPDMGTVMRVVAGGASDMPGTNASDLSNPVPADPFGGLSDDDGALPF